MVSLKLAEDNYTEQESELLKDKKGLKSKIESQEMCHQEEIRGLQKVNMEFLILTYCFSGYLNKNLIQKLRNVFLLGISND